MSSKLPKQIWGERIFIIWVVATMQTLQFGLFQVKDLLCFFQCISIIRHDILIKSSSADLLKELPGGVLILYQGFTNVAIRIKSNHCVKSLCIWSFSGLYFPTFEWIRKDTQYFFVFSPNAGKYGPEKLWIRKFSRSG